MRQGQNPNKSNNQLELHTHHRVIMVVYIPHESDFYAQSFAVFQLAIESLMRTQHQRSAITVIDNGCMEKVKTYLRALLDEGRIDQLIEYRANIGKIDALIGAARASREPLITLADADVLFCADWQAQVETVFQTIPRTGAVSPICMRYAALHATSSVVKGIVSRRLRYQNEDIPANFEANQRFMQSVNWPLDASNEQTYPVISAHGLKVIMGAPHQVITVRREVFLATVPQTPSLLRMGGQSVVNYIDYPVDAAGLYRFSTYGNFAFHMGNCVETWMQSHVNALSHSLHSVDPLVLSPLKLPQSMAHYTEKKRYFWRKIYKRFIGLNYQESPIVRKARLNS